MYVHVRYVKSKNRIKKKRQKTLSLITKTRRKNHTQTVIDKKVACINNRLFRDEYEIDFRSNKHYLSSGENKARKIKI